MTSCSHCQEPLRVGAEKCIYCGEEIVWKDSQNLETLLLNDNWYSKWWTIGFFIVAGLVVMFFVAYIFLISPTTPSNTSQQTDLVKEEEIVNYGDAEYTENHNALSENFKLLEEASAQYETNGTFDLYYDSSSNLLEVHYPLTEYIKDNPDVYNGPEVLNLLAAQWTVVDAAITDERDKIAEIYLLMVDLYPDYEKTAEAKRWLRLNKYEFD